MSNEFNEKKRVDAENDFQQRTKNFKEEDVQSTATNGEEMLNKFKDAIPKPLLDIWDDIKDLISLLKDYASKRYTDVPVKSIMAIGAAIAYLVSPIDVIPDIIPIFGFMDDAAVLALAMNLIKDDLKDYKLWKSEQDI